MKQFVKITMESIHLYQALTRDQKGITEIMNALKVLTLTACMGTTQKTVLSMHELQQLCFWLFSC